jgi:hypothetical protein
MSGLPMNLLAMALRSAQGGAAPSAGPRLPTKRAEDPDYLQALLQPVEAEEQSLLAQLRQTQAMGQAQSPRYSSPFAAGLGSLADVLRAGNAKQQAGVLNAQLRGNNQRRQEVIQAFGENPSASAVQRNEAMLGREFSGEQARLGREFQGTQADLDRTFRSGEAAKARAFESRQLGQRMDAAAKEAAAKAEADKAAASAKAEEGLRKEFLGNQVVKSFAEATVAFDKVQRAAQDPSAAGDLALIFGYMKTLDPGSTVREGEFANAQNAGGVDQRAMALYNRVLRGERLTSEQRADFVKSAGTQYAAQRAAYDRFAKSYEGIAAGAGADPRRVAVPMGLDIDLAAPSPGGAAEQPAQAVTPGATIQKNGKTYRLRPDGQWAEVTGG